MFSWNRNCLSLTVLIRIGKVQARYSVFWTLSRTVSTNLTILDGHLSIYYPRSVLLNIKLFVSVGAIYTFDVVMQFCFSVTFESACDFLIFSGFRVLIISVPPHFLLTPYWFISYCMHYNTIHYSLHNIIINTYYLKVLRKLSFKPQSIMKESYRLNSEIFRIKSALESRFSQL